MTDDLSNLVLFLGRFHPLLVHLPIGGLVLLGFLELLAGFTHWRDAAQNSRWILGVVSVAAAVSAACGWMLSLAGGYDPQLLKWHRATGLAVTAGCLLTFLLRQRKRLGAYRLSLAITLLFLAVAAHLGGSITYGTDFLTRYAPVSLRALFGPSGVRDITTRAVLPPMQQPVFAGVIEPILQQRCSACHGPEKHKADLRLDTLEGLLRGGQDGPVIRGNQAKESPLIQCILSPLDADGHMPPEDHPQPTVEEISLLEWWINNGAPASAKIVDLNVKPEIRRLLEIVSKRPDQAQ
jgi:uncharacterized membrane protein